MNQKDILRNLVRKRRAALDALRLRRAGARIQRAVMRLPEWKAARRVCLYLAMPAEAPTRRLLAACWQSGRQVLAPAYRAKARRYGLALLRPGDAMKAGHWSVPEPARPRWAGGPGGRAGRVDLALAPGLAFDRAGGRVGHGRGHYDRLLAGAALRGAFKVGLALECQVVARVPMNARDVRLDAVVTERAVYRRRTDRGGKNRAPGIRRRGAHAGKQNTQ